jgi:hypothetical protein
MTGCLLIKLYLLLLIIHLGVNYGQAGHTTYKRKELAPHLSKALPTCPAQQTTEHSSENLQSTCLLACLLACSRLAGWFRNVLPDITWPRMVCDIGYNRRFPVVFFVFFCTPALRCSHFSYGLASYALGRSFGRSPVPPCLHALTRRHVTLPRL